MSQPSSGRPMPILAGAIIALVMFGVGSTSETQAACGHYTLAKPDRDRDVSLDHLDVLSIDPDLRDATPQAPGRKPCTSPSCSEEPSRPNAPTPPSPDFGERGLCSLVFQGIASLEGSRLRTDEPSPHPVNHSATIERPPRHLPSWDPPRFADSCESWPRRVSSREGTLGLYGLYRPCSQVSSTDRPTVERDSGVCRL